MTWPNLAAGNTAPKKRRRRGELLVTPIFNLTGPGIELTTSRADSEVFSTKPTGCSKTKHDEINEDNVTLLNRNFNTACIFRVNSHPIHMANIIDSSRELNPS